MFVRLADFRLACVLLACVIYSGKLYAACNLQETPLTNEKACARFKVADVALNRSYKKIMVDLNSESRVLLRAAQRVWIRWRDERCDQEQEESGCNYNGSCNGVAHDICIIDLTNQRTQELKQFSGDAKNAKEKRFAFSKEYR